MQPVTLEYFEGVRSLYRTNVCVEYEILRDDDGDITANIYQLRMDGSQENIADWIDSNVMNKMESEILEEYYA